MLTKQTNKQTEANMENVLRGVRNQTQQAGKYI